MSPGELVRRYVLGSPALRRVVLEDSLGEKPYY